MGGWARTGFHDNNIEQIVNWVGRSDRRGGGWVGIGGVNSATNNNGILLFQLLFGPRFIGWVGGWLSPPHTAHESRGRFQPVIGYFVSL